MKPSLVPGSSGTSFFMPRSPTMPPLFPDRRLALTLTGGLLVSIAASVSYLHRETPRAASEGKSRAVQPALATSSGEELSLLRADTSTLGVVPSPMPPRAPARLSARAAATTTPRIFHSGSPAGFADDATRPPRRVSAPAYPSPPQTRDVEPAETQSQAGSSTFLPALELEFTRRVGVSAPSVVLELTPETRLPLALARQQMTPDPESETTSPQSAAAEAVVADFAAAVVKAADSPMVDDVALSESYEGARKLADERYRALVGQDRYMAESLEAARQRVEAAGTPVPSGPSGEGRPRNRSVTK